MANINLKVGKYYIVRKSTSNVLIKILQLTETTVLYQNIDQVVSNEKLNREWANVHRTTFDTIKVIEEVDPINVEYLLKPQNEKKHSPKTYVYGTWTSTSDSRVSNLLLD